MTSPDQNRQSFLLAGVLVALVLGAGALAWILTRPDDARGGEAPAPAGPVVHATRPPETPLEVPETAATEIDRTVEALPEEPPSEGTIRCVRRADRMPILGAHVYVDQVAAGGPSDAAGRIAFHRATAQPFVVWADGFRPAFVHASDETPTEVALGPADAALEVRIDNLPTGRTLQRSLLQPYAFPVAEGAPWAPVLREERFGGYRAEGLPAGAYDVYLWFEDETGSLPPLSRSRVLLKSGETTPLRFDAAQAVEVEPDG